MMARPPSPLLPIPPAPFPAPAPTSDRPARESSLSYPDYLPSPSSIDAFDRRQRYIEHWRADAPTREARRGSDGGSRNRRNRAGVTDWLPTEHEGSHTDSSHLRVPSTDRGRKATVSRTPSFDIHPAPQTSARLAAIRNSSDPISRPAPSPYLSLPRTSSLTQRNPSLRTSRRGSSAHNREKWIADALSIPEELLMADENRSAATSTTAMTTGRLDSRLGRTGGPIEAQGKVQVTGLAGCKDSARSAAPGSMTRRPSDDLAGLENEEEAVSSANVDAHDIALPSWTVCAPTSQAPLASNGTAVPSADQAVRFTDGVVATQTVHNRAAYVHPHIRQRHTSLSSPDADWSTRPSHGQTDFLPIQPAAQTPHLHPDPPSPAVGHSLSPFPPSMPQSDWPRPAHLTPIASSRSFPSPMSPEIIVTPASPVLQLRRQRSPSSSSLAEERLTFEIPSGGPGRLRVSLAWLRDRNDTGSGSRRVRRVGSPSISSTPPPLPPKRSAPAPLIITSTATSLARSEDDSNDKEEGGFFVKLRQVFKPDQSRPLYTRPPNPPGRGRQPQLPDNSIAQQRWLPAPPQYPGIYRYMPSPGSLGSPSPFGFTQPAPFVSFGPWPPAAAPNRLGFPPRPLLLPAVGSHSSGSMSIAREPVNPPTELGSPIRLAPPLHHTTSYGPQVSTPVVPMARTAIYPNQPHSHPARDRERNRSGEKAGWWTRTFARTAQRLPAFQPRPLASPPRRRVDQTDGQSRIKRWRQYVFASRKISTDAARPDGQEQQREQAKAARRRRRAQRRDARQARKQWGQRILDEARSRGNERPVSSRRRRGSAMQGGTNDANQKRGRLARLFRFIQGSTS